jgi:glycosyltransferase involved in cell wall biosynthesis
LDPDLSVVVMAFDEASSLEATTCEILAALADNGPSSFEVLIVDDGSADATGTIADRLAGALPHVRVVHHGVNRGLGGVYRTGFSESRGGRLTFFPADGQFPAEIIRRFAALAANADLVLGYLPDRDDSRLGRLLSECERLLYRMLFGSFPRFQGIFMVRRTVLDAVPLVSEGRGWAIVMELILRAQRAGFRVVSAPTTVRPRRAGSSKVRNLRSILVNLRQLLALRRRL